MYSFFSSKKNSRSALTRSPDGTLGVVAVDPLVLARKLLSEYFGAEVEALTTLNSWKLAAAKTIISELVVCHGEPDPTPRAAHLLAHIAILMQKALSEQTSIMRSVNPSKFGQALEQLGLAISTHYQDYGDFEVELNSVKSKLATYLTAAQLCAAQQTTAVNSQIADMQQAQECAESQGDGGRSYDNSAVTIKLNRMEDDLNKMTARVSATTEICVHFEKFVPAIRTFGASI